jgi:hypothetical protein
MTSADLNPVGWDCSRIIVMGACAGKVLARKVGSGGGLFMGPLYGKFAEELTSVFENLSGGVSCLPSN